jgi:hypothetical protein
MSCPNISSRVEQACELTSVRVNTGNIGAFELIASGTAQRQIARHSLAAMLGRDDVIQHVSHSRRTLRDLAIFAAIACQIADDLLERFRHF